MPDLQNINELTRNPQQLFLEVGNIEALFSSQNLNTITTQVIQTERTAQGKILQNGGTVQANPAIEDQTESEKMTKEELRETLAFLQECEIFDKNIKGIGNYSVEAQALQRIKWVLENNKNLEQAPQNINKLRDKFKDFLDDKVTLMLS